MAVAVQQQSSNALTGAGVEEKFYELALAEHETSLRRAIEHATGMTMDELAPGIA